MATTSTITRDRCHRQKSSAMCKSVTTTNDSHFNAIITATTDNNHHKQQLPDISSPSAQQTITSSHQPSCSTCSSNNKPHHHHQPSHFYRHRHRSKLSFFTKIMLVSNASMLCMMLVQGLKPDSTDSPPSSTGDSLSAVRPTIRPDATSFLTTDRGRQVFLATNTLPSANRFLQSQQEPSAPTTLAPDQAYEAATPAMVTASVANAANQFRPSTSAEHRLYETLFKRSLYQKNVRPVQNHLRSIKVRLGVCVMTIDEIIEKDQTMITSGCIKMKWSDEFLQWSPEAFQNLTWLVMPSTEIWLPDIALVNSPDPYTITRKPAFAEVTNTGQVGYYPSGRFSTRCAISLLFFPFDIQKCELRFESWVYPTQWLHIEPWEQNPIDMKDFYRNHQWDLERVSAIPGNISYDGLDFSTMRFIFYFRRRSLYYSVLSIFPGVLMSILQMFSHTLPVEHPARMTLLTSLFVSASVLQSSLASQMPKSSDGISLIQMYLMIFSSNLIISMVVTFINMHVWFRVPLAEVPNALRMLRSYLLDTGGTTGRPTEKLQEKKKSIEAAPDSGRKSLTHHKLSGRSSKPKQSPTAEQPKTASPAASDTPPEASVVHETDQLGYVSKAEQTDDEETSLVTTYCCGTVRHRAGRRGIGSNRRHAGESVLRRRKTASPKQQGESTAGTSQQEKPSSTEPRASTAKIPLQAVAQSVASQLTDRKERWLRFSMKVDKAFLYAMAIFNTVCPITIFLIVPQFQTYNDGDT